MAIFLLGPDPNGNCCDCNGRTSPCDSCCEFIVPYQNTWNPGSVDPDDYDPAPSLAAAQAELAIESRNCKIYIPQSYGYNTSDYTINSTSVTDSQVATNVTRTYGFPGPMTIIFDFVYLIKIALSESTTLRFDFNSDSARIYMVQETPSFRVVTFRRVTQFYEETYNAGEYTILFAPEYSIFGGQTTNTGSLTFISSITAKNDKKLGTCSLAMWYMDGLEKKLYTCEES